MTSNRKENYRRLETLLNQLRHPEPTFLALTITALLLTSLGITRFLFAAADVVISSDAAYFLGLGRSLFEEHSYRFNFRDHVRFPPGFPATVGAMQFVCGQTVSQLISWNIFFELSGLFFACVYLRRYVRWHQTVAFALLFLSNPYIFERSTREISSDFPYFFLSFLWFAIVFHEETARNFLRPILRFLVLVILPSIILTRSIGIALAIAALFQSLFLIKRGCNQRNLYLMLAVSIAGFASYGGWNHWRANHAVKLWDTEFMHDYSEQMRLRDPHFPENGIAQSIDFLERIFKMVGVQFAHICEFFFGGFLWVEPKLTSPLVVIPASFTLIGLITVGVRQNRLDAWYGCGYLGILLLWPWDEHLRFLLPLLPIIFVYLLSGFHFVMELEERRLLRYFRPLSLGITLFLAISEGMKFLSSAATPSRQTVLSIILWILFTTLSWTKDTVEDIRAFLKKTPPELILIASLVIVILQSGSLSKSFSDNLSLSRYSSRHAPVFRAADKLNSQNQGLTIMAAEDALLHYLTGLKVIPFPVTSDTATIVGLMKKQRVERLLVVEDGSHPYFYPTQQKRLQDLLKTKTLSLHLLEQETNYQIFKVELPEPPT